jgi:hypothetical protein
VVHVEARETRRTAFRVGHRAWVRTLLSIHDIKVLDPGEIGPRTQRDPFSVFSGNPRSRFDTGA